MLERASDGWWRGVNQSSLASGWFPSNYVVQNNHGHLPINDEKKRDSAFEESCGASSVANGESVILLLKLNFHVSQWEYCRYTDNLFSFFNIVKVFFNFRC